ncbi:MAG: hypothetical protein IKQ83_06895 [Lachnospiraceae bacterium]|nr:hypothetical protein [Lachnospiraceae bacterium]
MNIELSAEFKCLAKADPIERKSGGKSFPLVVMQNNDAGKISVSEDIYNAVEIGKKFVLRGVQTTFDGNTYISWRELIPFQPK